MHQDLSLNPLLDTFLVRHVAEIPVQGAEIKDSGPFVIGLLRVVIKDNLAAELMNPYISIRMHSILMLREFGDEVENFILNSLDKPDQCFHNKQYSISYTR